jgi:hypothetical protein
MLLINKKLLINKAIDGKLKDEEQQDLKERLYCVQKKKIARSVFVTSCELNSPDIASAGGLSRHSVVAFVCMTKALVLGQNTLKL